MATFKIAAFTCNTSGTRQNITPSGGPGTNPKAAMFFVSGATALDTPTAHSRMCVGMTDGTSQLCMAELCEDGVGTATADAGFRADNTQVITIPLTTSEAIDGEAAYVAWTNDGVAIDWADFPATALRGYAVFFYGTDLSAKVIQYTSSATQDTAVSNSEAGFEPTALICASPWAGFSDGNSGATGKLSLGFATNDGGTIVQACRAFAQTDRAANTSTIHRTDSIAARQTGSAQQSRLEISAFSSTGFTGITRGSANALATAVLALKTTDARARVVSQIVDTNATGQKFIEGFGFKPQTAFFFGGEATVSNTFSTTKDGSLFFGGAVSATEVFAVGVNERVGGDAGNADTYSLATSSGPIGQPSTAGALNYAATLTAFVHNGLNINVVDAGPSDYLMSFLAFEDTTARIGSDTERISDDFRLLVTIERKSFADTEQIADEFLFRTTDRKDFGDTEQISDAFRLVVTSDARALSDDEQISDAFAFATTDRKAFGDTVQIADATLFVVTGDARSFSDTEQLTDTFNFIVGRTLVSNDTVEIGDGFVLVSMGTTILISNDTEEISDGFVTVLAAGVTALTFVANETVELSDGVVMIRGQVLVSGDEVAISDAFNSGRGLIARKAIKRGRVF